MAWTSHGPRRSPGARPGRRLRVAASFGTIDTILEDLGTVRAADGRSAATRADLELVRVGGWGRVTGITDAGIVGRNGSYPVVGESESLAERW
ncbi:DUF6333 family protein [Nocardia sp. NPDC049190]|uniref:DUF6333 family protein n=1 Tax=Nocardia sp. NPDC049190 TaxID=3155650 RepID=UPI0034097AD6